LIAKTEKFAFGDTKLETNRSYVSKRLHEALMQQSKDRNPEIPYFFQTEDGRPKAYYLNIGRK
jgi:hypothetical protein